MTPLVFEESPQEALFEGAPESPLNALMTVSQAAQFLERAEEAVLELTKLGLIPCLRNGEERFIRVADVLDYQREREARKQQERESPLDKIRNQVAASTLRV